MRLATSRRRSHLQLGINVALSLASFTLGALVCRAPLSAASGKSERELVSGAVASAPSEAAAALAGPGQARAAAAEDAPRALEHKNADSEPSWARVAARAQSWTAAVRADMNYGAGVIVDRDGVVLTNLHVVSNAHSITITPFGGAPISAKVLDTDADLDLALLSANLTSPLSVAAELGSAAALGVGDEVLAVGSPRKMFFSVSRGMVSYPNRLLEGVEYVQTDLPINEGNSGGPLIDRQGRVVGIVSFILRDSQGLSFALPIDRAVARFSSFLGAKAAKAGAVEVSGASKAAVRELPSREPPRRGLERPAH
jgi:S1-C subfamily serine protease